MGKSKFDDFKPEEGDNRKYLLHTMAVGKLAAERVERDNPDCIKRRIGAYFNLCASNDMKPSVAGLALALGIHRQRLLDWVSKKDSKINPESREILQVAYYHLNALMEDYMQNGKINPASGIFLMKNNMGYEDTKTYTVQHDLPMGDQIPAEELKKKYLGAIKAE